MVEVNLQDGPCGWVIDPAASGCCTGWEDYPEKVQERAAILGAAWMWAATGRIYGQCETTVEICASPPARSTYQAFPVTGYGSAGWVPYMLGGGVWFNGPLGAGMCCSARCEITLPGWVSSTAAVTAVTIGETDLEPGDWQVYDHEILTRTDGLCWPVCCSATGGAGVEVVYLNGRPVPADVAFAADVMACEYAAACTGGECRLPRAISSLTQMGATIDFTALPGPGNPVMAIGIDEVDQVVKTRNPFGMTAPVRMTNPNRPAPRQPM